jgi:hypothetical protein
MDNLHKNYLEHHGILGMRWGRKMGPPYPLDASDHSAAEKKEGYKKSLGGGRNEGMYDRKEKKQQKANYKDISKIHKKTKDSSRPLYRDEKTSRTIEDKVVKSGVLESEKIKNDISRVKTLGEKWRELENSTEDFYDSKSCEEASKKAYDLTLKWFEKNDPEYLKTIIKNNGGEKAGLDGFHDFRKMYEGYEDEEWSKAKAIWDKTESAKQRENADKAWDAYYKKCEEVGQDVAKQILGEYGNKQISTFDEYTYNDLVGTEVSALINRMKI